MNDFFSVSFAEESKNTTPARLCSFKRLVSTPKEECHRHIHSTLELFYFESGEGAIEVGKKLFPIKAHDLFVVDSSKLHLQYSTEKTQPLVYYVAEADKIALAGFNKNSVTAEGYFHYSFENADNPIYAKMRQIAKELKEKEYNHTVKSSLLFNEAFIDVLRLVFSKSSNLVDGTGGIVNVKAMETVKAYIDEHFIENVDVETLANLAFMSKSYFITQFKTFFQITPKQYLNLVRVQHACTLLQTTEDAVMKVAVKVGFNNAVYFTEIFTKINKISPTEYRKRTTKGE